MDERGISLISIPGSLFLFFPQGGFLSLFLLEYGVPGLLRVEL
jgi:hypothetical protein